MQKPLRGNQSSSPSRLEWKIEIWSAPTGQVAAVIAHRKEKQWIKKNSKI
jgi:hypothetical protein